MNLEERVVRVVFQIVPDKGNAAVSQEILRQVETLKKKCEDIGTIQIKALGGAGELAEKSVQFFKNFALLGRTSEESSKAVEDAFKRIERVVDLFKGSVAILTAVNEQFRLLKEYAIATEHVGKAEKVAGSISKATTLGAAGSAGSEAEGAAQTVTAAAGLRIMLTNMSSQVGKVALIAAPYAGLAAAVAGLYEGAVHALGAMNLINAENLSLLESYRGWMTAAEEAAKSTREIAIQEKVRQARISQKQQHSQEESSALDERYRLIDAGRRHYELVGLGSDKNELLQKRDEAELSEQRLRVATALAGAKGQERQQQVFIPPVTAEEDKKHDDAEPSFLDRAWYSAKRAAIGVGVTELSAMPGASLVNVLPYSVREKALEPVLHVTGARVEDNPATKWKQEGEQMNQPRSLPAMPDYTTALKGLERIQFLQERGLETNKKEYDVLRDKSKEMHAQVVHSEELLKQAQARVGLEQNRAESTVAGFARLAPDVRTKAVSIAAEYEKTGKLSVDKAAFLDQHNLARDLTDQTFAASMGGKERHALQVLGMFKGLDEAKEAERKASEAVAKAKEEETKITKEMSQLKHKMLRQDESAFAATQLLSLVKEHIGLVPRVDRSNIPGVDSINDVSSDHPAGDALNRATQYAIQSIKQLGEVSKQKMEQLKAAEAALPQAAAGYRRTIDAAFENDVLPAITGSIRRLGSLITNSH